MATPGETPPEDSGSFPVAATAGEAQPIPLEGGQEGTQPTLVTMMSMLQRLADRVETMSTEQARMQDVAQATTAATAEIRRLDEYVRQGFSHFDDRVNRSRVVEQQMRDQLRSARTSDMPGLMPSDVKPAKIEKLSTTNIDELRNWFRHARGYLKYHNVNPEEPRSVYWASGYFHGPVSKWWQPWLLKLRSGRQMCTAREIRRERLNIMDDDGDDDEQYYSSAEGETTEQEDDLLMARRLTEEEFERFKKEGRCFICRAKGHVASACPSKKKKISEYRPRKTRPGN
eukprot:jgi/Tetstr1/444499/TSEL_032378.t1